MAALGTWGAEVKVSWRARRPALRPEALKRDRGGGPGGERERKPGRRRASGNERERARGKGEEVGVGGEQEEGFSLRSEGMGMAARGQRAGQWAGFYIRPSFQPGERRGVHLPPHESKFSHAPLPALASL